MEERQGNGSRITQNQTEEASNSSDDRRSTKMYGLSDLLSDAISEVLKKSKIPTYFVVLGILKWMLLVNFLNHPIPHIERSMGDGNMGLNVLIYPSGGSPVATPLESLFGIRPRLFFEVIFFYGTSIVLDVLLVSAALALLMEEHGRVGWTKVMVRGLRFFGYIIPLISFISLTNLVFQSLGEITVIVSVFVYLLYFFLVIRLILVPPMIVKGVDLWSALKFSFDFSGRYDNTLILFFLIIGAGSYWLNSYSQLGYVISTAAVGLIYLGASKSLYEHSGAARYIRANYTNSSHQSLNSQMSQSSKSS